MKKNKRYLLFGFLFIGGNISINFVNAQPYTKGIGIYPGAENENFSPSSHIHDSTYRNLAFRRPAYHSSSYDYNLTAQLITDGIRDTVMPSWISVSSSQQGIIPKNERENIIDRHPMTSLSLDGNTGWVQVEICGNGKIPEIDSINVSGNLIINDQEANGWKCIITGSDDGQLWKEIGRAEGSGSPGEMFPEP